MSATLTTTEHNVLIRPIESNAIKLSDVEPPTTLDAHALGLDLNHGTSYPSQSLRFLKGLHTHKNTGQQETVQARLPLRIVIVGAGLGGLATAIALARKGHSVVVLEQASRLGEVGAGIQIPPNSGSLLRRWGVFEHLESKAVRPDCINFRRWANGATIGHTDLSHFEQDFGAPYYVCHRAHFHSSLHTRAVELGVEIRLNSRVSKYHALDARVELNDGTFVSGDLVVAADGIRSSARAEVLKGAEPEVVRPGFAAYRATVDVEKMKAHEDLRWILEKPALNIWVGEDRHVMTYTISAGQSFNMVLSHVDKSDPTTWKQDQAPDEMRRQFQDWDPELTKILSLVDTCMKWPLASGAKLSSWVHPSSSLLILGDAAHAMVPYMSQGAAMAVEDGAALAIALDRVGSADEIPAALKIFESERVKRSSSMQEASMVNGLIWHYADGPEQVLRDAGMKAEVEGRPFAWSSNQWSDPVTQWWAYGYDAEEAIERAFQKTLS